MNSKGQFHIARTVIYWMIISVLISIVVLSFALIIAGYQGKLTIVPRELQADLISVRFTNLPECLAYEDNTTNVAFPGIIDIEKFSNKQLTHCYLTEDKKGLKTYNFRLVLEKSGEEIFTNNYFNDDDFTLFREVLVRHSDTTLEKDRLIIYVQERIGQ